MSSCLFSLHHPAHVHFFRNAISELTTEGYQVKVIARDKDVTCQLLDHYEIDYQVISSGYETIPDLVYQNLKHEVKLLDIARDFRPDVMTSIGSGVLTAYISKLIGSTSIAFYDTEYAHLQNRIGYPVVDAIYTPDCYRDDHGDKHRTYPGYHELAYLHPDRFEPDPAVLDDAGLDRDEAFVILRLIAWDAIHDVGDSGIADVVDVVERLEATGVRVLITSEANLPDAVERCRLPVEPHRIHDLMYYADLYIGESATMATESAVLGTPAVFISSSRRGYTDELEEEYELIFNFSDANRHEAGLKTALELLEEEASPTWEQRRRRLLKEKTDTTQVITSAIKEHSS